MEKTKDISEKYGKIWQMKTEKILKTKSGKLWKVKKYRNFWKIKIF